MESEKELSRGSQEEVGGNQGGSDSWEPGRGSSAGGGEPGASAGFRNLSATPGHGQGCFVEGGASLTGVGRGGRVGLVKPSIDDLCEMRGTGPTQAFRKTRKKLLGQRHGTMLGGR